MAAVASVSDSNTPSHGVSGQPSAGSPTSGRLSDAPCEPGAAAAGSIDGAAAALAAHQCSGPAAWACRSAALKHRFRIPGVTPKSPFGASPWIRYPSPGPHGPVGSGSVSATAMSTGSPGKSSQGSVGSDHNGSPFGRILNMYSVGVAGAARASPLSSGGASPVGGDPDDAPRGVVFCGTCGCWRKAKHGRCVPCSAAAAADVAEAWAATPFARRAASTPSPAVTTMTATTQPAAKRYRSEASARTAVDQDDEDLRSLAGTLLGLRDSAVSTPPAPSRPRAGSSGGNTSPASLHDKTGGPSSMTSPSGVTDPVVTPQRVPTSRAGLSASGRPLRAAAMRTRSRSIEDAVECGAGAGAGGAAGQFEAEDAVSDGTPSIAGSVSPPDVRAAAPPRRPGSQVCMQRGCKKRARFGKRRGAEPLWCSYHRKFRPETLVDIYAPKCAEPECQKEPSWGRPDREGRRSRELCAEHAKAFNRRAEPGQTLMSHYQWCQVEGCQTVAKFGLPSTRRRIRCAAHQLPDHRNLATGRSRRAATKRKR